MKIKITSDSTCDLSAQLIAENDITIIPLTVIKNDEQFKDAKLLTNKYFECDLLIIDDLGTEMHTNFTVSSLYNLINTRLNTGKSTLINTNLSMQELKKMYTDRITSRIFGCFEPLLFSGKDIRMQKLQRNM